MLLFIHFFFATAFAPISFQYISCYCLSLSRSSIFCANPDFNTSHVTVYRRASRTQLYGDAISIHLMLLFIGIGLTMEVMPFNFNTSHVTVYQCCSEPFMESDLFQYISCYCLSCYCIGQRKIIQISIHLMLLFIIFCNVCTKFFYRFQYISCYCLSNEFMPFFIFKKSKNPLFTSFFTFFTRHSSLFYFIPYNHTYSFIFQSISSFSLK